MDGEVLAGVDFELHPHAHDGCDRRVEAVVERESAVPRFPFRLAEPWVEHSPYFVDERPDGPCVALNEVDILRVSSGRVEEELVKQNL